MNGISGNKKAYWSERKNFTLQQQGLVRYLIRWERTRQVLTNAQWRQLQVDLFQAGILAILENYEEIRADDSKKVLKRKIGNAIKMEVRFAKQKRIDEGALVEVEAYRNVPVLSASYLLQELSENRKNGKLGFNDMELDIIRGRLARQTESEIALRMGLSRQQVERRLTKIREKAIILKIFPK